MSNINPEIKRIVVNAKEFAITKLMGQYCYTRKEAESTFIAALRAPQPKRSARA